MRMALPKTFGLLMACLMLSAAARAEDVDLLPPTITFVVSTGFWQDQSENESTRRKGYYKLVSVRQNDRSARVYLQQVAMSDSGPQIISTVGIDDLNGMHPFVTDIRAEISNGNRVEPGLFATVYLRTDPGAAESDAYTVIVNEFGELKASRASN
jgi:hypothetical protein